MLVELLFEGFDGVVGIDIDRVVHLHLQDQMGSALQIQSQVNVIGYSREQSLTGEALRHAEDPEQKDNQDADDE